MPKEITKQHFGNMGQANRFSTQAHNQPSGKLLQKVTEIKIMSQGTLRTLLFWNLKKKKFF